MILYALQHIYGQCIIVDSSIWMTIKFLSTEFISILPKLPIFAAKLGLKSSILTFSYMVS